MKRVYTTANGKKINIDAIIATNEDTIAVGNMRVNARGDQLGPGGVVEMSKSQVMSEYYKLNTPVAVDTPIEPHKKPVRKELTDDWVEPVAETATQEIVEEEAPRSTLRGSLAASVSTNQLPVAPTAKKTGPSRI
jgi:hypothetical protein